MEDIAKCGSLKTVAVLCSSANITEKYRKGIGCEGCSSSVLLLKPVKQLKWQGKTVSQRLFMFVMRGSVNTSAPCAGVFSLRAKLMVFISLTGNKCGKEAVL